MNKFIKTIFVGLVIWISIIAIPVQASEDLRMELISSPWSVIYGGETKVAEIKIINNTGHILKGEALFSAWYNEELFQGNSTVINPSFELSSNSSEWTDGSIIFSNFEIPKGENFTNLEIKTHPALIPGVFNFALTLKGVTEEGDIFITPSLGSGGGYIFNNISPEEEIEKIEEEFEKIVVEKEREGIFLTDQELEDLKQEIIESIRRETSEGSNIEEGEKEKLMAEMEEIALKENNKGLDLSSSRFAASLLGLIDSGMISLSLIFLLLLFIILFLLIETKKEEKNKSKRLALLTILIFLIVFYLIILAIYL